MKSKANKFITRRVPLFILAAVLLFIFSGLSACRVGPRTTDDRAQIFIQRVNGLPNAASIGLDHAPEIAAADLLYGRLTDEMRASYEVFEARQDLNIITEALLARCMGSDADINRFVARVANVGEVSSGSRTLLDAALAEFNALSEEQQETVGAHAAKIILDGMNAAYTAMISGGSDQVVAEAFIAMVGSVGTITPTDEVKRRIDAAYTFYDTLTPRQRAERGVPAAYAQLSNMLSDYNLQKAAADNLEAARVFINAVTAIAADFHPNIAEDIVQAYLIYNQLTDAQRLIQGVVDAYRELMYLENTRLELMPLLAQFTAAIDAVEEEPMRATAAFGARIEHLYTYYQQFGQYGQGFASNQLRRVDALRAAYAALPDGVKTYYEVAYTAYNPVYNTFHATSTAFINVGSFFNENFADGTSPIREVYVKGNSMPLHATGGIFAVRNIFSLTAQPVSAGVQNYSLTFVAAGVEFPLTIRIAPPLAPVTDVRVGTHILHQRAHEVQTQGLGANDVLGPITRLADDNTPASHDFQILSGSGAETQAYFEAAQRPPFSLELYAYRVHIFRHDVDPDGMFNEVPYATYDIRESHVDFSDNLFRRGTDGGLLSGGSAASAFMQLNIPRIRHAVASAGFFGDLRVRVAVQRLSNNPNFGDGALHRSSLSNRELALNGLSHIDQRPVPFPVTLNPAHVELRGEGNWSNWRDEPWWLPEKWLNPGGGMYFGRNFRVEGLPILRHPEFDHAKIYIFDTNAHGNDITSALGYIKLSVTNMSDAFTAQYNVSYHTCLTGQSEQPLTKTFDPRESTLFNYIINRHDFMMALDRLDRDSPQGNSRAAFNKTYWFAVQLSAKSGGMFGDSALTQLTSFQIPPVVPYNMHPDGGTSSAARIWEEENNQRWGWNGRPNTWVRQANEFSPWVGFFVHPSDSEYFAAWYN
ncbi:MAG: hypothetical protein FWH03_04865 [Firmicutes bacterium]|nr:hypothetical protein [Bacillota bacterium]